MNNNIPLSSIYATKILLSQNLKCSANQDTVQLKKHTPASKERYIICLMEKSTANRTKWTVLTKNFIQKIS